MYSIHYTVQWLIHAICILNYEHCGYGLDTPCRYIFLFLDMFHPKNQLNILHKYSFSKYMSHVKRTSWFLGWNNVHFKQTNFTLIIQRKIGNKVLQIHHFCEIFFQIAIEKCQMDIFIPPSDNVEFLLCKLFSLIGQAISYSKCPKSFL